MKRTTLALLILLSSVIFMSCRSADESLSTPPSTFAVEFSLGEIIDANKDLLLAEGIVTGRETSSIPDAFYQLNQEAVVQLDLFDEAIFMQAIRADIECAIIEQADGINSTGRGSQDQESYFSNQYNAEEKDGLINVWGVRGLGADFVVIVLIVEGVAPQ